MKITLPKNAQVEYFLLQKDEILGRCYSWEDVHNAVDLRGFSQEFPFSSYFFLPTEKFTDVKFLFDEELRLIYEKRWGEEEKLWKRIYDADLWLQNVETGFKNRICVPAATDIVEFGNLEKSRFYTHIEVNKNCLWFREW